MSKQTEEAAGSQLNFSSLEDSLWPCWKLLTLAGAFISRTVGGMDPALLPYSSSRGPGEALIFHQKTTFRALSWLQRFFSVEA